MTKRAGCLAAIWLAISAVAVYAQTPPAPDDPDSAQAARERAALVDFVLDPAKAKDEPVTVRCPMFGADLNGFYCRAYNASDQAVGSVYFSGSRLPVEDRRRALDNCASQTVEPKCIARVEATVDQYGTPIAASAAWAIP